MNRKLKIVLGTLLALAVAGSAAAQAKAPLTVVASEGPAQVILSGKLIGIANPRLVVQVKPGSYELIVRKNGVGEFKQRVVVPASGLTVRANLGGASAPAPQPAPAPKVYRLNLQSSVPGAEVYINGVRTGSAPLSVDLSPGSYNLTVKAPGYQDYSAGFVMNGPQNLSVALVPLFSTVTVSIPNGFLNRSDRGAANKVEIYLDGARQNSFQFQVSPGRHTVGVLSGGFMAEVSIDVMGGRSYTVEPAFTLVVR